MTNLAYIFPGQGAQYVGMGEDFYHQYPQSRQVFEQANQILNFDLTALIFNGPFEQLTRTAYCQVAIFTVSIAYLQAWESEFPQQPASVTAGLSLGEYAALVAAGAISFEDGLRLVQIRAQYMEEASQKKPGGMVSVLGLSLEAVEALTRQTQTEVANLNSPGQIVISGSAQALEQAKEKAHALGAKKTIVLNVGGAFHSSFMEPARQELVKALEKTEIRPPRIPVISNVTAQEARSVQEIRENLARQVVARTLWEDSVRKISASGIQDFLEIGPGKVLKGLLRKIDPALRVYTIETVQDLASLKGELL